MFYVIQRRNVAIGSFGAASIDLGPSRTAQIGLQKRRTINLLKLNGSFTTFHTTEDARGRRKRCLTPSEVAFGPGGDPTSPYGWGQDCSFDDLFTHPVTGAYKGIRDANGLPEDPALDAFLYLYQGEDITLELPHYGAPGGNWAVGKQCRVTEQQQCCAVMLHFFLTFLFYFM